MTMSWRTVVISNRCKLDYKMGYMVVRGDVVTRILLDEISLIMVESTAVSISAYLITELAQKKIKVVFCDHKQNPLAEMSPLYGCHDCSLKIKQQITWDDSIKSLVWTEIVTEKIRKQMGLLQEIGKEDEAKLLESYIQNVQINDISNREGHAAKVYFNALFGMDFTRSDDNVINASLNYGYSVLLSAINREIVSCGYLTQLGIFHDNMFNQFNLTCDLMEPFRIIIDRYVYSKNYTVFTTEEKHDLVQIMNLQFEINGAKHYLANAIKIYCHSVFAALNDRDVSLIKFYSV